MFSSIHLQLHDGSRRPLAALRLKHNTTVLLSKCEMIEPNTDVQVQKRLNQMSHHASVSSSSLTRLLSARITLLMVHRCSCLQLVSGSAGEDFWFHVDVKSLKRVHGRLIQQNHTFAH